MIDMSPGYLSEVERGLKLPGSELYISLKRNFNVDIDSFFPFGQSMSKEDPVPYVYTNRLKNHRTRINNLKVDPDIKIEFFNILLDIYEEKSE